MVPRGGIAAVAAMVRRIGSVGPTVAQRFGGTGRSLVFLRRGRGGFFRGSKVKLGEYSSCDGLDEHWVSNRGGRGF